MKFKDKMCLTLLILSASLFSAGIVTDNDLLCAFMVVLFMILFAVFTLDGAENESHH